MFQDGLRIFGYIRCNYVCYSWIGRIGHWPMVALACRSEVLALTYHATLHLHPSSNHLRTAQNSASWSNGMGTYRWLLHHFPIRGMWRLWSICNAMGVMGDIWAASSALFRHASSYSWRGAVQLWLHSPSDRAKRKRFVQSMVLTH